MLLSHRIRGFDVVQVVGSATDSGYSISFSPTTAGDIGVIFGSYPSGTASGWTRIEAASVGSLYVKTMTAGETSASFGYDNFLSAVVFLRGALLPSASNSSIIRTTGACDAPVSPIAAKPEDITLVFGYSNYSTKSVTANMPSGYTEIEYFDDAGPTWMIGAGYRSYASETSDPDSFPWGVDGNATSAAATIVIQKS